MLHAELGRRLGDTALRARADGLLAEMLAAAGDRYDAENWTSPWHLHLNFPWERVSPPVPVLRAADVPLARFLEAHFAAVRAEPLAVLGPAPGLVERLDIEPFSDFSVK